MSVCLSFFVSVCLSVQYFSQKWVIFSFWFFCAMLDNWNIKKQTEICFSRKIQFCPGLGKRAKIGFFDFWKNIVTDISPPIPYSAKLWLWSYGPKCYWPIKFQDSLKCNISRKKLPLKNFPQHSPIANSCRGKSAFSLMYVSKLLPRQTCLYNIHVNIWINYCKK